MDKLSSAWLFWHHDVLQNHDFEPARQRNIHLFQQRKENDACLALIYFGKNFSLICMWPSEIWLTTRNYRAELLHYSTKFGAGNRNFGKVLVFSACTFNLKRYSTLFWKQLHVASCAIWPISRFNGSIILHILLMVHLGGRGVVFTTLRWVRTRS